MPRRPGGLTGRLGFRLALVIALAPAVAACQSDLGSAGCSVARQVTLAASPLTLMSHARLDRLGGAFALSGVDSDGKTVRWLSLDEAGIAGPEHQLPLDQVASGPWLAFTGDTLLIVQGLAAANGADVELRVIPVPTTGAAATPPAGPVLAVVPGALMGAASPGVAVGASRTGGHATLAWYDAKAAAVETVTLTAAGTPLGEPKGLEPSTPVSCLAFVPGRDAATLTYYRYPDATSTDPELVITELDELGVATGSLQLLLASHAAGCPQVRATAKGYVLAFEDAQGGWLGVYDAATNDLVLNPFSSAVAFPGARQPPLVGLVPVTDGYAVAVQGPHGGELWRLDDAGYRRPGALYLPSLQGTTGEISTAAAPDGLFATYADYTSAADAGLGQLVQEGQRFFVRAGCF